MIKAGERLYEERIRKGLSLEEVAKATRIRSSFLSAIEKGEYKKLPSGTYAHGFVRNYARFLGLPEKELLALFKREFDGEKIFKIMPEGLARAEDFPLRKFKFAQNLKIVFLVLAVLFLYLAFQYRYAILNPPLDVFEPKEGEISSEDITVIGKTDSNATLSVNNEVVSLDKEGNFKKNITLFPGKGKIVVKAVNHFSKTTTLERHVEVIVE